MQEFYFDIHLLVGSSPSFAVFFLMNIVQMHVLPVLICMTSTPTLIISSKTAIPHLKNMAHETLVGTCRSMSVPASSG